MERDRTAALILRIAARGMFNCSEFDPFDTWSRRRLHLLIKAADDELTLQAARDRHQHWLSHSAAARSAEAAAAAIEHAAAAFSDVLRSMYPWYADILGENSAGNSTQAIEEAHAAAFGKPGEPRYEAMVDNVLQALKRGKMTQSQKEARRRERQARWDSLKKQEAKSKANTP